MDFATHEADARREKAAALKAARDSRKGFVVTMGRLAKQLTAAMVEYLRMREEGVAKDDACRGLELELRDVFKATKFAASCAICEDIGWRETVCTHRMRCDRKRCGLAEPAWEHPYVVPCDCTAGDRKRERVRVAEDAIAAVGRTRKPKAGGWRQMGN